MDLIQDASEFLSRNAIYAVPIFSSLTCIVWSVYKRLLDQNDEEFAIRSAFALGPLVIIGVSLTVISMQYIFSERPPPGVAWTIFAITAFYPFWIPVSVLFFRCVHHKRQGNSYSLSKALGAIVFLDFLTLLWWILLSRDL